MMKRSRIICVLLTALAAVTSVPSYGLGTETFGNKPLPEGNYKDWPGIVPVANHVTRVYQSWVNGNEHFYYAGDIAALNDTLAKFAVVNVPVKEVVLRPGPGEVKSFDQTKKVSFNWSLHVVGGIAKHVTALNKGTKVWSPNPVLTVYLDRTFDLKRLSIPQGVEVKALGELKRAMREGLTSTDKTVRGWGAGQLAQLDPYDVESRDAIAALLKDQDDWVRMNAVGAITLFGSKARAAIPLLKAATRSSYPQMKERAQESIEAIEGAEDRTAEEREHRRLDATIQRFVGSLNQPKTAG
jgi:hypothetical protein